jgi:hypothetical protein
MKRWNTHGVSGKSASTELARGGKRRRIAEGLKREKLGAEGEGRVKKLRKKKKEREIRLQVKYLKRRFSTLLDHK